MCFHDYINKTLDRKIHTKNKQNHLANKRKNGGSRQNKKKIVLYDIISMKRMIVMK